MKITNDSIWFILCSKTLFIFDDIIDIDWTLNETSHGFFGAELAKQKGDLLKKISKEQKEFFNRKIKYFLRKINAHNVNGYIIFICNKMYFTL